MTNTTNKSRYRLIIDISLVALCLLLYPILHGSEARNEIESMNLEDLLSIKVTVASKSEETIDIAPSSVTVFTSDDIRRMGISNLDELINYVPGFQSTRDIEQGTANRISSRGRSTAISESVLFLINGQRINDLYTGGVSIINRLIAIENIKQVEFIRGPGSALYGSNAFLGVVNIVTDDSANEVTLFMGSQKSNDISINFSKKFSGSTSLSSFVKVFSDSGFQYRNITDIFGQNGDTRDPVKGLDAFLSFKTKNLAINGRHTQRSLEDFIGFGGLNNGINTENTRQTYLSAEYRLKINDRFETNIGAGYVQDHWKAMMLAIPKDTELAPGFVLTEPVYTGPLLESFHKNINLDCTYRLSEKNELKGGFTFSRSGISKLRTLFSHDPITLEYMGQITEFKGEKSFNEEATRDVIGFYLQDKIKISGRLNITAGLRFDNYSDFGSTLSPRLAIIYSTSFGSTIKAMYGRAFRAPNFMELYDKNNPVDFGNTELKPEKIETLELAYIQNFNFIQATATVFSNRINDIIIMGSPVEHPKNPFFAPQFHNAGQARMKGLELELKSTPFKNVMVNGTFTHFFKGDTSFVSSNFASFIFNYAPGRFNLNVNGIYREKIAILPNQKSYVIVNSTLQYNVNPKFTITGTVKNLFDESYLTVSIPFENGVYNRGRIFTLGFSWKY